VVVAKTGCVNYTTIEEIPEGKQVLMGTFSLNGYPTVVCSIPVLPMISSARHALEGFS
jgi:hypothetical protein